jgi:putative RNA 2'-phosphotransferase
MTQSKQVKISKFLSFILRHKPEEIGLALDKQGWAEMDELIAKANQSSRSERLNRALIQEVVASNDKKRFSISEDGQRIRANQGHTLKVDLKLKALTPPETLYHGTAKRFLDPILQEGLKPRQRHHVHLSEDIETATAVGQRYGKPVVLIIHSQLMHEQGIPFYQSDNGVWLTDSVTAAFISQHA